MADPRIGCLLARRPQPWQKAKAQAKQNPAPPGPVLPERTFQFSPKGDLDSFVKVFSGDMRPAGKREQQ